MDFNFMYIDTNRKYPKVEKCFCSNNDLNLLHEAYAGQGSELQSILTYIYQSITLESKHKEIAKIIKKIAISEMKHLDLLAETIIDLGGHPIYTGFRGKFFDTSCIDYNLNMKHMLNIDIQAEENAINGYKKIIRCAENKCFIPLIECFIEDEINHLSAFKHILNEISYG